MAMWKNSLTLVLVQELLFGKTICGGSVGVCFSWDIEEGFINFYTELLVKKDGERFLPSPISWAPSPFFF